MEHLARFGLSDDPFCNDPRHDWWVELGEQHDAVRRLERAVRQGRSLCVLTGDSGSGKTSVARELYDALEEEAFESSLLVVMSGRLGNGQVLRRIASQVGVAEPASQRGALLKQLHDRLVAIRQSGRRAVVIVDEAQHLAAEATLEELRGILNLEHEDRSLVTIVLVGQRALEHGLSRVPALARRVDVKVRLTGLSPGSIDAYLDQRLRQAGGDPTLLPPETRESLARTADGLPRALNTLADNALYEAFLAGAAQVTPQHVERAAALLELELAPDDEVLAPAPIELAGPAATAFPADGPPKDDDVDDLDGLLGPIIEEG